MTKAPEAKPLPQTPRTSQTPKRIEAPDLDWVFDLNQAHTVELSPLNRADLAALLRAAFYARTLEQEAAFLIAFDQDAAYDSPNFLWFRGRFDRFVYVDRIAVSAAARGRGLARQLYEDLFAAAQAAGHRRIACEINTDPPNPASDSFHAALGFHEAGRATLPDRAKTVRYLTRDLSAAPIAGA